MKYVNIIIFLLLGFSWNPSYGETTLDYDTLLNVEEYQEEICYPESDEQEAEKPEIKESREANGKVSSERKRTAEESAAVAILDLAFTALMMGCK